MSGFLNQAIGRAGSSEGTVLSADRASKNVKLTAAGIAVLIILIGLFFPDRLKFGLGVFLGALIAEMLFIQNERSIQKIFREPEKADRIGKTDYMLRMVIRGAAVVIGYLNPYTNLAGTVIGLVVIPAAIYLLALVSKVQLEKQEKISSGTEPAEEGDKE